MMANNDYGVGGVKALKDRHTMQIYNALPGLAKTGKSEGYNQAVHDLCNDIFAQMRAGTVQNEEGGHFFLDPHEALNPKGTLAQKAQELGLDEEWQRFTQEQAELQQWRQPLFTAAEKSDTSTELTRGK